MYGHMMEVLDIGGGFPQEGIPDAIVEALEITRNDQFEYRVVAEPGRFFSSDCFLLCTRVIGERIKEGKKCLHINDSVYHSFNCMIMDNISFERDGGQFYKRLDVGLEAPAAGPCSTFDNSFSPNGGLEREQQASADQQTETVIRDLSYED